MRAWVIVLATVLAVGLPADAQFRTSRGQAKVGGPIHATQPSTGAAASTLTFDLQPSSGTSNLSTTLSTVTGSVALDPVVVCNLSNATADNIACTGATLTRQGVSPTLAASAPFTDSSTSVDFSTAQDEYVAANNTVGNVRTCPPERMPGGSCMPRVRHRAPSCASATARAVPSGVLYR
jgi:hypothetical protein